MNTVEDLIAAGHNGFIAINSNLEVGVGCDCNAYSFYKEIQESEDSCEPAEDIEKIRLASRMIELWGKYKDKLEENVTSAQ